MTTYNTGNPLGSTDPRDLYDNAQNLDSATNDLNSESWVDRLGVFRRTWYGMEQFFSRLMGNLDDQFDQFLMSSGYEDIGDYGPGLVIERRNQIFRRDGELYRASAAVDLPYVTSGVWVSESENFVSVGDAALRQQLASPAGAGVVGFSLGTEPQVEETVESKLRETVVTIRSFGAKGDGVTNDHDAFVRAAEYLNSRGGGTLRITRGVYPVFRQWANPSPSSSDPYWISDGHALNLIGLNGVRIIFEDGASLVSSPGLRYGSFDPETGERYDFPGPGSFTNSTFAARIGEFIRLENCRNVEIINPRIDGKNGTFLLGGTWGNGGGIQLRQCGIALFDCNGVVIHNPSLNDCGLDGLYIAGAFGNLMNIHVINIEALRNGRQGISWVGGQGVTFVGGTVSLTGKGAINSPPAAGIDIEDNGQGCYDGLFLGVSFFDCAGAAVLILHNERAARIRFVGCYIANPDTRRTLWSSGDRVMFEDCDIYGSIVNAANSEFHRCYLTNKPFEPGASMWPNFLDMSSPVRIVDCLVECYSVDNHNFNLRLGPYVERTRFRMMQTDPPVRFSAGRVTEGCTLKDCEFTQSYSWVNADPTSIESPGEATFITAGAELLGRNTISGGGLAWASRTGNKNGVINAHVQNSYSSQETATLSGTGPVFDVPIEPGNHLLTVYKTSGALQSVVAVFLVSSTMSSNASNHVYQKLVSREAAMGTGGSISMAQVGNGDVVRFTEGTVPLAGETWTFRKIGLTDTFLPAPGLGGSGGGE